MRDITPPAIKVTQQQLECVKCGAQTHATCNCGMSYRPVQQRVAEYDEANPGKSTRQAAADLDVSQSAIQKARQSGEHQYSPDDEVTGRDGKTYPATKPQPKEHPMKATLAEYHTASRAIGVLEYFVSEFDALDLLTVARGCTDDDDIGRISRGIEQASKHIDEFRTAMEQEGGDTEP